VGYVCNVSLWYDVVTCKSKQIIGCALSDTLFSKIVLFLMFLNIQIDFIILKTDDEQFILTTRKKSLHITLKSFAVNKLLVATPVSSLETGYNLSAVVPGTDLGLAGSSFVLVVHLFWKMILGI